jgi:SAM-dependent methyltransferase
MNFKYLIRRFMDFLRKIRSVFVKVIKPNAAYYLYGRTYKSTDPLSRIYGYDRGNPIDRYYIEKFMEENSKYVKGACMEITDNDYTVKYGGKNVITSDAFDIDTNNPHATIYGDLRNAPNVKDNTYDCIIVTQTLVMIDDYEAAIRECHRMLKPGGVMLCTMPCFCRVGRENAQQYWRFTSASSKYIFGKIFGAENIDVKTWGNVLSGQAFWVGIAREELTKEELDAYNPEYPLVVTIRATKAEKSE